MQKHTKARADRLNCTNKNGVGGDQMTINDEEIAAAAAAAADGDDDRRRSLIWATRTTRRAANQ
ncbi:unnamed protein product [Ceratitis capitata]|uniref:(Mediterranean fruit fly) hypothetical protein n=1 Tax=Ceratitis capitata TaxID=7213 RepID=A0A811V7R8_CERCA|nr:unnamed protein product [Ceratitis capitata]